MRGVRGSLLQKYRPLASVLPTASTRIFSLRLSGRRTRLAPHVWQPNFTHALHSYRSRLEARKRASQRPSTRILGKAHFFVPP